MKLSLSLSRDVKVQTLLVWLICVLGWWWWRRKSERNRTVLRGVRSNECWAEGQWFFFFFLKIFELVSKVLYPYAYALNKLLP